jgi:hypothetical protein
MSLFFKKVIHNFFERRDDARFEAIKTYGLTYRECSRLNFERYGRSCSVLGLKLLSLTVFNVTKLRGNFKP